MTKLGNCRLCRHGFEQHQFVREVEPGRWVHLGCLRATIDKDYTGAPRPEAIEPWHQSPGKPFTASKSKRRKLKTVARSATVKP